MERVCESPAWDCGPSLRWPSCSCNPARVLRAKLHAEVGPLAVVLVGINSLNW